jgi:adenosylhomocysteinase
MTTPPREFTTSEGARRIAWAARGMPVLTAVAERLAQDGPLRGLRIGIALVLEPKTANLAYALAGAGAEVTVYGTASAHAALVADALRASGIDVHIDPSGDGGFDVEVAREFLHSRPQILIDDGAALIRLAHAEFPEVIAGLIGAAEETTSGVRPLRQMAQEGALKIPVVAVNDARMKYLFDNVYGTGQSCVMALLDLTNLQLAGRTVVVVGYGWVGMGVARHAAALGARVVVSELDPIKALRAHYDGYRVAALADVAPEAEVVFAATGIAGAITPDHVHLLRDGAILCTAGGGAFELPMDHLRTVGTPRTVRNAVVEYALPSEKHVLVVSDGECLNCVDGEGNPIEVMDLSLSLQALAVQHIALHFRDEPAGVTSIPVELEETVARIRLAREGATVETLTPELAAAMRAW